MRNTQDTDTRVSRGAHAARATSPRAATSRAGASRATASRAATPRSDAGSSRRATTRAERRAERTREARVAPDRASASRPAEPRQEAASRKTINVGAFFSSIGDFVLNFRVIVIAVLALAALVVTMYGPAQTYYKAWRAGLDLQSQLDELNASNEQYKSDIQSLQTREGIEDEARRRGYVSSGETKVVVEGTSENAEGDSGSSSSAASDLPWYVELGDKVFHYVP